MADQTDFGYAPGRSLVAFAAETGLHVRVAHLPTATSKWNKIEHRFFSPITTDWRGRPMKTHQIIVDPIAATTTNTGLTVPSELDTGDYPIDISYTDKDIAAPPLDYLPPVSRTVG